MNSTLNRGMNSTIPRREKIIKPFKPIAWFSIFIGIVFGFIIIGLDTWIFNLKKVGLELPKTVNPPAWQGFLASFYGGIAEEVLLRLFLLSLLVWIGNLMTKNKDLHPNIRVLWIANIIAAVIFGLGHLPATKGMGLPLILCYHPSNCPEWSCRLSFWMVILDSGFRKLNDSSF
jgi:membrane protease YdiL (CAAX protease family)